MEKQAAITAAGAKKPNSPFTKEKTLIELYFLANGGSQKNESHYKIVHHGAIDKIPPKGWEDYSPHTKKKRRYLDTSEDLNSNMCRLTHDLEDK
ncbi:hypothetical protein COU37_01255 [Candidatus Micrarchaeota archaeon CG10_big_fil_rev_8_21_14_0_10_45_29]|nr:MAG: hypothetical protein COU37_01255 [Candidatus Micrarchaeota archaeon CG10_big_fil_rev_8_21_14_0_10_45_29]